MLLKNYLFGLIVLVGVTQASAVLLTWDNLEQGRGLHVFHRAQYLHANKGEINWEVRETRKEDAPFYQAILRNIEVVKTMASGKPWEKDTITEYVNMWVKRSSDGNPALRMILEQEKSPVGFVHLAANGDPGVGEVIRALVPEAQGYGLGKAALGFLVNDWAPAVRQRGLGSDVENKNHPSIQKFQCFGGEPLSLIYTTARPSNERSWKCYKYFDFKPSPTPQTTQISCENWEVSKDGELEAYLTKRYFSPTASEQLKKDVLYPMVDEAGNLRTLSFVTQYRALCYHFERNVDQISK